MAGVTVAVDLRGAGPSGASCASGFAIIIVDSMLVLALDTTTRTASCALARDGRVIRERASVPGQSHAEHLPGDVMRLLEAEQIALESVDAFAAGTGPGSFTGMRVGIATMQGLAFAMRRPLVGVSGLDALARIGLAQAPAAAVATWVDAWRGEVYAALYRGGRELEPPTVEPPAAVAERHRRRGDVLFIGDGAGTFEQLIRERLGDRASVAATVSPLLAGTMAQMAHDAILAGSRPTADAIRPLYVRRIDAELARDARTRP
jgi:tRNA threonylcarbamoyladenosine biosynthesis protein TsaB